MNFKKIQENYQHKRINLFEKKMFKNQEHNRMKTIWFYVLKVVEESLIEKH